MWAARKGDSAGVNLLLNAGACPDGCDLAIKAPLHSAAESMNLSCVKLLLAAGASPSVANCRGANALHLAAYCGSSREMIECLVTGGIDPNAGDFHGSPPLFYPAMKSNIAAVEALLDFGSDINLPDNYGDTALHTAIWLRSYKVEKMLLQRGASYTQLNFSGQNVLHITALYGDLQSIQILVEAGLRDIDTELVAKDGSTAPQIAQRRLDKPNGFVEQFDKLLDGIRERNATKAQNKATGNQAPGGSGSVEDGLRSGSFPQKVLSICNWIPYTDWLRALYNYIYRYSGWSLWMTIFGSWVVGFSCAGLLYVLLSTERLKA